MQANKTLSPYGLQLYLYLASNLNNYSFALSPAAAEEYAGIKKTSFRKYLKLLEIEGYLVRRHGNIYDFYTTPRDPEDRTHPDEHIDGIIFENSYDASRNSNASGDQGISSHALNHSPLNREIDNRIIDNNIDAGFPRTPASPDAVASASPSIVKKKEFIF